MDTLPDNLAKSLLEDASQGSTQDFIMINYPVLFANEPERYLALLNDQNSNSILRKSVFQSLA